MAINSVNGYRDFLFQWQGQQLKSTGNSSSSQSSAINSLFGQNSMTNQIASMVELTRYAMDAMGVDSNARVTFSQITKYANQLQTQFNQQVKEGFAASGISNPQTLSFSMGSDGKINVVGGNESDRKLAQAWMDANPDAGKNILRELSQKGIEINENFQFSISSTGKMTVLNTAESFLQEYLISNNNLSETLNSQLYDLGLDLSGIREYGFDDDGNLVVKNDEQNAEGINDFLSKNTEFANGLKKELQKYNIDLSSVSIRINNEGSAKIFIDNGALNGIQNVLNEQSELGKKIYSSLGDLGIDAKADFSIQLNSDGSINIISDHPDRDKIQQFFESNPELIKLYKQIETLAGVEDARKALQISPVEMRKRIQIESMSAWWAESGNSSSYFGRYDDGALSLLSGLNMRV